MHFLRFGSSIPGDYWGCCACDIIQNFHKDPDEKVAIQIVSGDGGSVVNAKTGKSFVGKTYREIFEARLRFGTFSTTDMPNHGFIAIITQSQIQGATGKKWLAILKENGFEFIRTISNSVYTGQQIYQNGDEDGARNYVFALFRNIGVRRTHDPFTPPKEWQDLPSVKPEAWEKLFDTTTGEGDSESNSTVALARAQEAADLVIWDKIGPAAFITEKEAEEAGCTVIYAGKRSLYPQQTKDQRLETEASDKNFVAPAPSPFAKSKTKTKEVEPVIDVLSEVPVIE